MSKVLLTHVMDIVKLRPGIFKIPRAMLEDPEHMEKIKQMITQIATNTRSAMKQKVCLTILNIYVSH